MPAMITLTSTEAQNRFGEVMDTAQREPITITRRGRPLVFIISPDELSKLFSNQKGRDEAVAAYEAYLGSIKHRITSVASQVTDADINQLVHELR